MNGLDINENGRGGSGSPNSSSQNHQRAPPATAQDNLNFDPDLPAPPQDNNQVAAWYDTDL